jgi:hypothetical protein
MDAAFGWTLNTHNIEMPCRYELSDANTMLKQFG